MKIAALIVMMTGAALAAPTASDGTRYYQDSIVVAAPAAKLWEAFTVTDAYRKWAAPVSAVDFRLGGVIEASYDPNGHLGDPDNIKNMIVGYVPGRSLSFRNVQAPKLLPGGEVYGQTVKTLSFEPLDAGHTRVTVTGVGFAQGAAYDKLYAFFSAGDAEMLKTLKTTMERP